MNDNIRKVQLLLLIKQYVEMYKDIMNLLETFKDMTETDMYQGLYNLGNDIAQQLDEFKNELKQLERRTV